MTVVGDNGSKEVRCTETGYNTQAIICSGRSLICDIRLNERHQILT